MEFCQCSHEIFHTRYVILDSENVTSHTTIGKVIHANNIVIAHNENQLSEDMQGRNGDIFCMLYCDAGNLFRSLVHNDLVPNCGISEIFVDCKSCYEALYAGT